MVGVFGLFSIDASSWCGDDEDDKAAKRSEWREARCCVRQHY